MIKVIVAVDDNWGIAKDGKIPWHVPEDFKQFKELTTGNGNNVILMGRKTKESLPTFPLPNRVNLVLTSTPSEEYEIADYMEVNKYSYRDMFIIGGKSIYEYTIGKTLPGVLYISRIPGDYECDIVLNNKIIEKNYEISTTTEFKDFNLEVWNIKR